MTTNGIMPFHRPRYVDPVDRMRRGLQGDCYRYAAKEADRYLAAGSPLPALYVVHGFVKDWVEHAWVERGDFAYDWQMFASDRAAEPVPLAQFYEEKRARKLTVYTPQEANAAVLEAKHWGPWTEKAAEEIRARAESTR